MKVLIRIGLAFGILAILTSCSSDDATPGGQAEDYNHQLVFEGHHFNGWLGFESGLPDYLLNFDDDFTVIIEDGKLSINQSLVEMFEGYRDTNHLTEITCYEKGYSADRRIIVFGLEVPPMEWFYMPTGPEGEHIPKRTEFSTQSEAIYNSYTGSLDIFLYSERQYSDGKLSSPNSISYSLSAQRVDQP